MKKFIYLISLLIIGCTSGSPVQVSVEYRGELREIMHQGKYQGRILLDSMNSKGIYALGALDSLRGEIFINDGETIVSQIIDSKPEISTGDSKMATLLVYSDVLEWEEMTVESSSLDSLLSQISSDREMKGAFPFKIKGAFPELKYHIINFDNKTGDLSKHKEGSWVGNLEGQGVTILGFYSTNHEGIFTHMGSSLHMHVINDNKSQMGHIDHLELGNQAFTLLLPSL